MPSTLDPKRVLEVIEEIRNSPKFNRLTAWEIDFLETVEDSYRLYGGLSEKRMEILEEIHLRV